MTRSYFLRSERLGFSLWAPQDRALATALWGDPRVTLWIGGPFEDARVQERLSAEIANQSARGISYWPVFRLEDGTHVGCCGLRPCPDAEDVLEIGFHLRPEHWGRGYATEAARAVIEHAFGRLGARELVAGHHPANEVSRGLLRKLGFRYTRDTLYAPTGLMHPTYALTVSDRGEWASF